MNYFEEIDPIGEGCETVDITEDNFLQKQTLKIAQYTWCITGQLEHLKVITDQLENDAFLSHKLERIYQNIHEASSNILETLSDISEKYDFDVE